MTNTAKSENVRSGELTGIYPKSNCQRFADWLLKRGKVTTYRVWQKPEKRK